MTFGATTRVVFLTKKRRGYEIDQVCLDKVVARLGGKIGVVGVDEIIGAQ